MSQGFLKIGMLGSWNNIISESHRSWKSPSSLKRQGTYPWPHGRVRTGPQPLPLPVQCLHLPQDFCHQFQPMPKGLSFFFSPIGRQNSWNRLRKHKNGHTHIKPRALGAEESILVPGKHNFHNRKGNVDPNILLKGKRNSNIHEDL